MVTMRAGEDAGPGWTEGRTTEDAEEGGPTVVRYAYHREDVEYQYNDEEASYTEYSSSSVEYEYIAEEFSHQHSAGLRGGGGAVRSPGALGDADNTMGASWVLAALVTALLGLLLLGETETQTKPIIMKRTAHTHTHTNRRRAPRMSPRPKTK